MAAKWALVAILVPFLLVGCASLDKARQIFEAAGQSRSERLLGLKVNPQLLLTTGDFYNSI
ncbi:hypothetical protein LPA99_13670 [Salmonella enterica subsp. enterica]